MNVECKNCNVKFHKLNNEIKKHPQHFCSRACSASFNNRGKPAKNPTKERHCKKCHLIYKRSKQHRSVILCPECSASLKTHSSYIKTLTLAEYHNLPSIKGKHSSWLNSHVRVLNRSWNKELTKQPCLVCGYTKHIQLAHIQAISSFPSSATLGEINSPSNNLPLCPNHHWEFDNNELSIKDANIIKQYTRRDSNSHLQLHLRIRT